MKKTTDEELNKWRRQLYRAPVSLRIKGDKTLASLYFGEAYNLLYQLKNSMEFNLINQSQNFRFFNDGTRISASSVYGLDALEIDVTAVQAEEKVVIPPSCSITLLNVPIEIQPMKWYAEGIHTFPDGTKEVEGVDYIKTYYRLTSVSCDDCLVEFSICKTAKLQTTYGWFAPQTCKPFTFKNDAYPVNKTYPNDHCIYGNCQAEIIKFGRDEGGGFFIWKAYTEWGSLGPNNVAFTQSGLGYLLLNAAISLPDGTPLCKSDSPVLKVDCCLKPLVRRPVLMFWEKCGFAGDRCPVPKESSMSDIDWFWVMGGWQIMMLWTTVPTSQQFSCPPYNWALTGPGTLNPLSEPLRDMAVYFISTEEYKATGCQQNMDISVTDRCGRSYPVHFESCCAGSPTAVDIGYTTLLMSCSEVQTFTVNGGCAPYTWSLTSGGGTLVDNHDGTATYTADADNAGCAKNPTINVSDCCGSSDSVQIAVNCWTADVSAYRVCDMLLCEDSCPSHYHGTYGIWWYRCQGTQIGAGTFWDGINRAAYQCYSPSTQLGCPIVDPTPNCSGLCLWQACGTAKDNRSEADKANGCCPLNPMTGLPF